MNAVLWCGGTTPNWREAGCNGPACLLPLVDRPMVQHVVEQLVDAGYTSFHLLCDDSRPAVERALGDGSRWGARFAYWHAFDSSAPTLLPRFLDSGSALFAAAATMPLDERALTADDGKQVLFMNGTMPHWTGWSRLSRQAVAECTASLQSMTAPEPAMPPGAFAAIVVERVLDVRTPRAMLSSQALLLQGAVPNLELTGRQPERGVWIGRGASVHPSARLIAPVHVGSRARIGAQTEIGPFVVVGEGSLVDRGTVVRRASIAAGNYVGPDLDVDSSIAVGRMLIDTRLGVAVEVADRFLMDRL